jgi:hypothetical protein
MQPPRSFAASELSHLRKVLLALTLLASTGSGWVGAQESATGLAPQQSLDEAWWTGPMLANTPATAPPGHVLFETYLFDVMQNGQFDANGTAHRTPRSNDFGSLTYLVYGAANHFSLGLIPIFGYNTVSDGLNSSHLGVGDLSAFAQYQLTQFHVGSWLPTIALNLEETFPTGAYDRLGERPADGLGSGAYTTMFSVYSQTYFWMPNGRILRMRLDLSAASSHSVEVNGVSVYGTDAGFVGHASPGSSFAADAAWEYSATKNWVLAADVVYHHLGNTRVAGVDPENASAFSLPFPPDVRISSGTSDFLYVAPAVEYNWTAQLGLLVGLRVAAIGRNTAQTITPAIALNVVR